MSIISDNIDRSLLDRVKENKRLENQERFFGEKGGFYHHEFAKYITETYYIVNLDQLLHIYVDGIYINNEHTIEQRMIEEIPKLKKNQRTEVLNYIKLIAPEKQHSNPHYISCKNGVYDIMEETLHEHSPEFVITSKINATYDETAYSAITDMTLLKIANEDQEVKTLFEEIFGYLLYKRNFLDKSFLLVGPGGNGKSTLMRMYRAFVGQENVSAISLAGLIERFNVAELHHKLLNAGDDIPLTSIKDASVFKKLSTGELISAERKGQDPFYFENYAKLIFSANGLPRWFENSAGVMDRLVIVPLYANLRHSPDKDPFIDEKITTEEARSHMLNVAIRALRDLLKTKNFTIPNISAQRLEEFKEENNPIISFLAEINVNGEPTKEAYLKYKDWCMEEGHKFPMTRKQFTQAVSEEGYITKSGRHTVDGRNTVLMTFYKN